MEQNNTVEVVKEEIVNEVVKELTLEDFKNNVIISPRIGFLNKQAMAQSVYDNSIVKDVENDVYYVDAIMQSVTFNINMLSSYTNFYEVYGDVSVYGYDYLNNIGIFDYVYTTIDEDDIAIVEYAINKNMKRVDMLNSTGACLRRTIKEVIGTLPEMKDFNKLLNNIPKMLNKVDKETLEVLVKEFKNGNVAEYAANKKKKN